MDSWELTCNLSKEAAIVALRKILPEIHVVAFPTME
jgi:hypothetical protein